MLDALLLALLVTAFGGTVVGVVLSVFAINSKTKSRVAALTPMWLLIAGLHPVWLALAFVQPILDPELEPVGHAMGASFMALGAIVVTGPCLVVALIASLVRGSPSAKLCLGLWCLLLFGAVTASNYLSPPTGAFAALTLAIVATVFSAVWLVVALRRV